jgi:hypothetical protein
MPRIERHPSLREDWDIVVALNLTELPWKLMLVSVGWRRTLLESAHYARYISHALLPALPERCYVKSFPYRVIRRLHPVLERRLFELNDQVHCSVMDPKGRVVIHGSTIVRAESYNGAGGCLEFEAQHSEFDASDVSIPSFSSQPEPTRFWPFDDDTAELMDGYTILLVRVRRTETFLTFSKCSPDLARDCYGCIDDNDDYFYSVPVAFENLAVPDGEFVTARVTVTELDEFDDENGLLVPQGSTRPIFWVCE